MRIKALLFIVFTFICSVPSWANTYYVRDGGGVYGATSTTCNGLTNVVYTTGNGPNCAVNDPGYILGWGCFQATNNSDCDVAPVMAGGDTLFIDGDSDITPGTQAQYRVGYSSTNASIWFNTSSHCGATLLTACQLGEVPAGTSGQQTSVIGTGTHKPQFWGGRPTHLFRAENDYTTLQWLEFTQHFACASGNATQPCSGNSYVGNDGLLIGGVNLILTDIYVHGISITGINTDAMTNPVFTRVWVIGNGQAGMAIGYAGNQSMTGTLTWNQPIIEWNGCVEQYPLTNPGIDNPLNYLNCFGNNNGGYGDGLPFAATGSANAGNWTIIGPGSISFNTQDGVDKLHGTTDLSTDNIDKMRFEGNAGQQLKLTGLNDNITNNLIVADCGWWQGSSQAETGALTFASNDACRANGTTIYLAVTGTGTYNFYNNTIISSKIGFETGDSNNSGCSGTVWNIKNNIFLGGYSWRDNTGINSGGDNELDTYYFNDGFSGGGTCSTLVPTEDYNVISSIKDSGDCAGAHDKCATAPGFSAGTFPNGTSGAGQSSYYTGQSGITLLGLSSGSAAKGAGVSGLTYWNNSNDYYNNTRASPPSSGGLEQPSLASNGWGCFYNSDCSSNTCVSNICASNGFNGYATGAFNCKGCYL